jgi:hypothetical protein
VTFVCCEHPVDAGASFVSLPLPCCDLISETLWIVNSAAETLPLENADLDLDHKGYAAFGATWSRLEAPLKRCFSSLCECN